MDTLQLDSMDYLAGVMGLPITWFEHDVRLPPYLAEQYELYVLEIDNQQFLGIYLKDNVDFRPAIYEKHLKQLLKWAGAESWRGCCLVARQLPGYVRQRLVERRLAFVVPQQQVYWPELGVLLKARQTQRIRRVNEAISPATQCVVIAALNGHINDPITPKALAEQLGYTPMTMTRALDEIETHKIGRVVREGRERHVSFADDRRMLWQEALPWLRNPVKSTVHLLEVTLPRELRLLAGETALAARSFLSAPKEPVYAMSQSTWRAQFAGKVKVSPFEDERTCCVQLWCYDPALFSQKAGVDPFSLYLSLQDERDERVQESLEALLEKTVWL